MQVECAIPRPILRPGVVTRDQDIDWDWSGLGLALGNTSPRVSSATIVPLRSLRFDTLSGTALSWISVIVRLSSGAQLIHPVTIILV